MKFNRVEFFGKLKFVDKESLHLRWIYTIVKVVERTME